MIRDSVLFDPRIQYPGWEKNLILDPSSGIGNKNLESDF
jgi:hypothetical protein